MALRGRKINWQRIAKHTIKHLISVADNQVFDLEETAQATDALLTEYLAAVVAKYESGSIDMIKPPSAGELVHRQELRLIRGPRLSLVAYGNKLVQILASGKQRELGLHYLAAVIEAAYLIGLHCEEPDGMRKRREAKISRAYRALKAARRAETTKVAISANPSDTNKEIARLVGVSERTVRRYKNK
jgi:hypothetical protein